MHPLVPVLVARACKTEDGFTDFRDAAAEVVDSHPRREALGIAFELYERPERQARCVAVQILGLLASHYKKALAFLRNRVSRDPDWRVQEMLAMAFDRYCRDVGYEAAWPVLNDWLADPNQNVRRAVSEGLRIWTSRTYFREHPEQAVALLSPLRADESEYVRKSIGNALRDISKAHPGLIRAELETWDTDDKRVKLTYKLASRFIEKQK